MISRNQFMIISTCLVALISLNSCAKTRESFGLNRHQPDEFTTPSRPPLDRPKNSNLVAPKKGAQHRGHGESDKKAHQIVTGSRMEPKAIDDKIIVTELPAASEPDCSSVADDGISRSEQNLLNQARADEAEPGIRNQLDQEIVPVQPESVVRKLLYWQKNKQAGDIINPVEEYTKLRKQNM